MNGKDMKEKKRTDLFAPVPSDFAIHQKLPIWRRMKALFVQPRDSIEINRKSHFIGFDGTSLTKSYSES